MSDYYMTHEVNRRINDLHHQREAMRQAEGLAERPTRIRRLSVQPVRLVKAVQAVLNAIAHVTSFSQTAAPSPYAIPDRTPLAADRSHRP